MAQEITQTVSLSATKGGATVNISSTKRVDMTGTGMIQTTQSIGTSAEAIALGDLSGAPSMIEIKNLDATNFVEIGGDSGLTVFKLKLRPGHATLFQPSAVPLYAKADTAAVLIQLAATEI